jgi:hypothetical protein
MWCPMRKILLATLLLTGCGEPKWRSELTLQCAGWLQRARSDSDSLHVEMTCAAIAASKQAGQDASAAAMMSAASMGASSAAQINTSTRR